MLITPLLALVLFVAGGVAGILGALLGLGGGIIKVPALNAWCGVPLRAAAATSAFMIGVTATVGASIYFWRGQIVPTLAAAAVLGVLAGSRACSSSSPRPLPASSHPSSSTRATATGSSPPSPSSSS